ncbi:MAG: phosphorylase, partial [Clostridia bacterium]|nr:phosphorylase [Clostridia bacterium]
MHGWRRGVSRADASRQVFWVFRQAGVKKILAEGGVGSINHLLRPRDVVIPNDYIDMSMRKDVEL